MSKEHENQSPRLTLADVARKAQEVLLEDGYHVPTLIIEGHGRAAAVQVTPLAETPEARFQQMQRVGFTLARQDDVLIPERVFFVTEGWLSKPVKGEIPQARPSQDPDRIEVLMVSVLDIRERGARVNVFALIRDDQGQLRQLRKLPMDDEAGGESRAESPLLEAFVQGFALGLLDGPRN